MVIISCLWWVLRGVNWTKNKLIITLSVIIIASLISKQRQTCNTLEPIRVVLNVNGRGDDIGVTCEPRDGFDVSTRLNELRNECPTTGMRAGTGDARLVIKCLEPFLQGVGGETTFAPDLEKSLVVRRLL